MSVWIGYLEFQGERVEMTFHSVILNEGLFNAQGSDRYGNFTYEGTIINREFRAVKHYSTWNIYYHGNYDPEKVEIFGYWGYEPGTNVQNFKIQKVRNTELDDFRINHGVHK